MTSAKPADTAKRRLLKFRITATAQNITLATWRSAIYLGSAAASRANFGVVRPRISPTILLRLQQSGGYFCGGRLPANENIMPLDYFAIASKPAAVLPLEA